MSQATNPFPFTGLSDKEVAGSRIIGGTNAARHESKNSFWPALKGTVTEPMFVLLIATALIYFLLRQFSEGGFMLFAILLVSIISFYQDSRSRRALEELKTFTRGKARVIRNNQLIELNADDVVIGDYVVAEEGALVVADGNVVRANDFSVNESVLTGESFAVIKHEYSADNIVYQGTLAVSGLAVFVVTAIGSNTELGKIAGSLQNIEEEKTPLQKQIEKFVRNMAIVGVVFFLLIWGTNFYHTHQVLDSFLKGLTLAMSILPEEIPVAFTSFMALGAWRLMKLGIIVKQTKTVETLGSATVICTDKTGTLTENKMQLAEIYVYKTNQLVSAPEWKTPEATELITIAMWASEPVPFDPMEVALHKAYETATEKDLRPQYKLVHEYPLAGRPPMMTHVFENDSGHRIIAAKGAAENIMRHSNLSSADYDRATGFANQMLHKGYRVLAIAQTEFTGNDFKKEQEDYAFSFLGFVAYYDPPKKNISEVLQQFYAAGIDVKIITGDNALTTSFIARQAHFKGAEKTLDGEALLRINDNELKAAVMHYNIFTRMFPEAKLRIIRALKDLNNIVAMTGDGVNDSPALKAAHIGIAMGKRGSEIAKQASALVLVEDDLARVVDAIAIGRKIYSNLKKAIQYIISIHVPIILTVSLPLLLNWKFPNIFTPVHVIFLELVMGPTCSLAYENEPLEKYSMLQPPRQLTSNFLQWKELSISLLQGLVITVGTMAAYQYAIFNSFDESQTRAMVFTTLVVANIFLTLVNRSFNYSIFTSITYKNNLMWFLLAATVALLACMLYVPLFSKFFRLSPLGLTHLAFAIAIGFISVIWFDLYKALKRAPQAGL
jgi:P-type Ca2+ transporter type 2C